ncbi:hypothetical protein BGZ61DRAFT_107280 [Ilyonectria robusta]|jgi:hypothetical protein|uniref:uncharacterized protein n=1 Tax=Ilyonectria robusta TaxID=1079257 RepID=UPI001E8EA812|nr:uncharacterized protein BGZ61DRAFT_107280 [Ilyonectria robusta]KAH8670504.1 hypothetical protein BGZ61DRAFT_107280 [Ilyonectria robusta]
MLYSSLTTQLAVVSRPATRQTLPSALPCLKPNHALPSQLQHLGRPFFLLIQPGPPRCLAFCPFTFALTHFASTPLFYYMPRIPLPLIPRSCLSGSSQLGSTIRWLQNSQEPQPERLPAKVVHQIGRGSGAKLFRRADADCCKPSHVPSLDRCAVTYLHACMDLLCMAPRSRANGMVCFWIPRSVFVLP